MNALNIRPVTDLRNKYPDVESDVQKGPVFFHEERLWGECACES